MAEMFENNILGFIPQKDWLNIPFQVTRPNDPIDGLFGDTRTANLVAYWQSIAAQYQIPVMAQFHGFDTEARTTFRVPVDTHNIEKGLIKVKINQSERMRALLRSGVQQNDMYDYVIRDGINLSEQVVTRTKVAKNELLATGKVTIKENNLDLTVDYGVPSGQTSKTLDLSESANVPKLLQALIDEATDNGVTLTGIYTSKANITKMRSNAAIQKVVNGNVGAGALVRADAFNAYLNEEFGIQRVIANDLTYAVENGVGANGRPNRTTKRYYPKDKITLFAANPAGRLGEGLWGDPPETDAGAFMQRRKPICLRFAVDGERSGCSVDKGKRTLYADALQSEQPVYRVCDGGITELSETPTLQSANLGGMTKAELLAYAAEKGVEGVGSSMNKADIVAAIKAAETEQTNA